MKTIRLWRLGYIDTDNPCNSILPTAESIAKLRALIKESDNTGGTLDIIWGPDLSLDVVTYPDGDDVVDFIEIVGEEE